MPQHRMIWIDGLKGVCAIIVVLHHLFCAFYPSVIFGPSIPVHTPYESWVSSTPLNLFVNGNFAVCIFFLLSGYLLSYPFFYHPTRHSLLITVLHRYTRLMIPTFLSFFLAYLMMKLHLFSHLSLIPVTYSYIWLGNMYNFVPTFLEMIWQGIGYVYLEVSGAKYNTVTWSISYEWGGSLLIILSLWIYGKWKYRWMLYIFLCLLLWKTYFFSLILGMMLADPLTKRYRKLSFPYDELIGLLFILYFGSYPLIDTTHTIYAPLNINLTNDVHCIFYHTIAAGILFLSLERKKPFTYWLEKKWIAWVGRYSFSIYLLQLLVICSYTSSIFSLLFPYSGYHLGVLIATCTTFPILILCAWIYQRSLTIPLLAIIYRIQEDGWIIIQKKYISLQSS